ncbi:MAG: T9SS type A sorting domain-containing protein [Ignavibacteria bacterium]
MKKRAFLNLVILTIILATLLTSEMFSKTVSLTNSKRNKLYPVTSELNSDRFGIENLIIWTEETDNGTLFAQKLNPDGSTAWGDFGIIIISNIGFSNDFPIIHPDQTGGAVIILNHISAQKEEIIAIKINFDGTTERPVSISGILRGNNSSPSSVVTEHDLIVITWENYYDGQYDIYAQAIDYNVNKIWNDEQPAKVCDYENDQRKPTLATDGMGGVFVMWLDNRNAFESNLPYRQDIYASRLDHDGTPYLNGHKGNLILSNSFNSISDNTGFNSPRKEVFYNHNIISSDNGTILLASDMFREGQEFIKLLKINTNLQVTDEIEILGKERTGDVRIYSNGNYGAFLIWKDKSFNSNLIMGSEFDKNLITSYPENGAIISCEQSKGNDERILPDIRIKNSMTVYNNKFFVNWTNTDANRLFISNMNLTDESYLCNNTTEIQNSIDDGEYTSFTSQSDKLVIVYKYFNNIFAEIRELNEATKYERTIGYRLGNFPNPFNPTTSINFFIPKDGFVSLKIYDITGKEVRTVLNGFKPSGEHKVTFSANELSSGAYFYRLDANGIILTRRMTILK